MTKLRSVVNRIRNKNELICKLPVFFLKYLPIREVIVEPIHGCNLRCSLCPSSTTQREKGEMNFNTFVEIFKRLPSTVRTLQFGMYGEPYLNTDINKMVKFAVNRGILSTVLTNGTLLNEHVINGIIEAKTNRVIVGIDGACKETYEKYRISGNFEHVLENARNLSIKKKINGSSYPYMILQFIIMRYNQHEIEKIIDLASGLGFDGISFITLSLGSSLRNDEEMEKLADQYLPDDISMTRYNRDHEGNITNKYKAIYRYCPLWRFPVILFNGDVTICCYDSDGQHTCDNILNFNNLLELWHSPKHANVIKNIIKRTYSLCNRCSICTGYELANMKLSLRQNNSKIIIE